jgi:hypothetical protein
MSKQSQVTMAELDATFLKLHLAAPAGAGRVRDFDGSRQGLLELE